ncbi:feline leukemia virus subgroup C receptor-related protein 2-like isoform X1 [Neodiprion fabricii]|uniref:feline leukemia virus subgroup C receptor-related protein 2-like isoform X1 n=1 Tax=Neodiprion fabricii TaxID=2872261 RepID=UPI001ED90645|nr:feline leukemia virus subgroup C receptor-related protein 2-like isoform X1 [Neodiprion fabricii]
MEFGDVEEAKDTPEPVQNTLEVKVFKRRWFQLALFILYSVNTYIHMYQYTIISNIICRYYNVSSLAVAWTTIISQVVYLVLIIPCSYLINLIGLRWSILTGATVTCLGAWIKVFSVSPDRFAVTLIGQTIIFVSKPFIRPLPGLLAAHWFGPKQTAFASTMATCGTIIGISLGYTVIPMIVKNHEKIEKIGQDLSVLFWSVAVSSTVVCVALMFLIKDKPRVPPSAAKSLQIAGGKGKTKDYLPIIRRILSNRDYLLLLNSVGIVFGVQSAMLTMLNPLYLQHFKNSEKDAGMLGSLLVIAGAISSITAALIVDKSKKFREIAISFCVLSVLAEILFAVSFFAEIKWMVFVAGILLWSFLSGYITVNYELNMELTYPEPENISSGLLFVSISIYNSLLILILDRLMKAYGDKAVHALCTLLFILSTFLTCVNKSELRRQKAAECALKYKAVPQK